MGQFFLGMAYDRGTGVPQDYVQAYMWLNLAASNSSAYIEVRDKVAKSMSPEQIDEGQRMARNWKTRSP